MKYLFLSIATLFFGISLAYFINESNENEVMFDTNVVDIILPANDKIDYEFYYLDGVTSNIQLDYLHDESGTGVIVFNKNPIILNE